MVAGSKLLVRPAWLCSDKRWLRVTGADRRETRGAVSFLFLHVLSPKLPSRAAAPSYSPLCQRPSITLATEGTEGAQNHFDLFIFAKYRKYRARYIRVDHLAR